MSKENLIIGLSGPSAVGKGYCKEKIKTNFPDLFIEPIIITTRPKKINDGPDRCAGVSLNDFFKMKEENLILFPHQPFGESSDWYGFLTSSFDNNENLILTEIHPDNITPFKSIYKERVSLIGLVAASNYLELNIRSRGSESEEGINKRLLISTNETTNIKTLFESGFVDHLIEIDQNNRDLLGSKIINLTNEIISRK